MAAIPATPTGVTEGAWVSVVADVRAYCGWHIAPEITETVTVDGSGSTAQLLPTIHLTDLVSITNDGESVSDPEWSKAGIVRGVWTRKYRGVVAEMTHGYEEWPDELLTVMAEIASTSAPLGVKQATSGTHQVTFDASLRPSQRVVLDRYSLGPRL